MGKPIALNNSLYTSRRFRSRRVGHWAGCALVELLSLWTVFLATALGLYGRALGRGFTFVAVVSVFRIFVLEVQLRLFVLMFEV